MYKYELVCKVSFMLFIIYNIMYLCSLLYVLYDQMLEHFNSLLRPYFTSYKVRLICLCIDAIICTWSILINFLYKLEIIFLLLTLSKFIFFYPFIIYPYWSLDPNSSSNYLSDSSRAHQTTFQIC